MDAAHEIRRPLGQVLVDQGLITAEQLEQALAVQSETEKQLGEVLVLLGFISPGVVANGLAEQHGGPLKTEYGISAGFGGERPEPPQAEPQREAEPEAEAPDVLAPWRAAVEQRDAAITQLRGALDERNGQVEALAEQLAASAQRIAGLEKQTAPAPESEGLRAELAAALARVQELEVERDTLSRQLVASAQRISELEEQLAGRESSGEELRVRVARREEELAAALARVEEAATQTGAGAAEREALQARLSELESERDRYAATVEELRATVAAQTEDLAAREAEAGNLGDLEKLLEHVSGVLHARIAELESERAGLQQQLADAAAAAVPAPESAPAPTGRSYDESSHHLWVSSADGYRLLERSGPAPNRGETVEVDGVARPLVVARLGPSPFGSSKRACAYLVEA